jgi:hypothetical protein
LDELLGVKRRTERRELFGGCLLQQSKRGFAKAPCLYLAQTKTSKVKVAFSLSMRLKQFVNQASVEG